MTTARSWIFRPNSRTRALASEIALQCPDCHSQIGQVPRSRPSETSVIVCPNCLLQLRRCDGVWDMLARERKNYFDAFIANYERIRSAEGRGSRNSEFYLSLPERDVTGRNQAQWEIRNHTFQMLQSKILTAIEKEHPETLDILDLGAGNCWLSYRLALRGHRPVAVDLLDNDFDGLGAARHYRARIPYLFPRFRAELDFLPFAEDQFDVAIFNASLHYSEDYERTLTEALRCLRRPGWIIIADTAWYSSEQSGETMLRERKALFQEKYGMASDALRSLEYLTDDRLRDLEIQFGLQWKRYTPHYGLRWSLRPLIAKLRGRREPSQFRIYAAEVAQ